MNRLIEIPHGLQQSRRSFFNRAVGRAFEIRAQEDFTLIDLYDEIGFFGVSAAQFKERLNDAGNVRLRINSPGGSTFDGLAMYNDLLTHQSEKRGRVEVEISGMALSAASLVAMAGETITIAKNAFMMIHNSWLITIGDKNVHLESAELLKKVDVSLAMAYSDRTGLAKRRVTEMMNDETWMNGEEAVENGFADKTMDVAEALAKFDVSDAFKNTPEDLIGSFRVSNNIITTRDLERALRDVGYSVKRSKALAGVVDPNDLRDACHEPDGDLRDVKPVRVRDKTNKGDGLPGKDNVINLFPSEFINAYK